MNKCCICDEDAPCQNDRYFVVPGYVMVPNCYALCDKHKGRQLIFEDFYNPDASRKALDKERFK
jgi:hypothetical protein